MINTSEMIENNVEEVINQLYTDIESGVDRTSALNHAVNCLEIVFDMEFDEDKWLNVVLMLQNMLIAH